MSSNNELETTQKKFNWQKFLAPAALVLIYIFFALFGRNFFSYTTLVNILDSSYYIGFLAIGVTFVIITGGIDLSLGTVMMCAAIVGGTAYKTWGWPIWAALLLIIIVAVLFGIFNGIMVSRLSLPPFIATMGTMMISMGVGSIVSNVRSATFPTRSSPDGWFKGFFKYIAEDRSSIPTGAIILFGVAIIAFIVLTKTKLGRYIFAIGSNKEAARLSGVNVKKWEMMAYIISGFCAGLGGIAFAAVYTTVMPAQGAGFELYAIAGAVIGGTSLAGGSGTILGTMIGVYIMSVLRSGLPSMDLQSHYQTFFTGVVVVGAVLLDVYRNKRASQVKVLGKAAEFKQRESQRIIKRKAEGASAEEIAKLKSELKRVYAELKQQEKEEKISEKEREQESIRLFNKEHNDEN